MSNILAIESSCDETAAAVISRGQIRANCIATQAEHEAYGGVVPELASRAHQRHIVPVVRRALDEAGIGLSELSAVAFTQGPGLMGALLVGASFAKGLALALDVPLIGVHHIKAHILAHFIDAPHPKFPFLCLTVSGGHTQLVCVKDFTDMHILGQTQDDAVGEAFDKTAKLLGLGYPGGPEIDRLAQAGRPDAFQFPITDLDGFDFSFSGIKTSILYFLRKQLKENPQFIEQNLHDLCASVQQNLIENLMRPLIRATEHHQIQQVAIAGGVSANRALRARLQAEGAARGWQTYIPDFAYCTDNAAMIAMAAHYQFLARDFVPQTAKPQPRMPF
ncbi:MAG: tRNA (adenosine(37)-N6)-threonylcarbamoyltransferase complex transferase subunit TsaD [Bernardetiaceae bacterium]